VDEPVELDARGLSCPLPVLRAKKALRSLGAGQRLRVLATDPSAVQDFEAFCAASGHRLEESVAEASLYRFLIVKGGPA
jgi:tRNA 2-thiouridine synthesizing protein A